MPNSARRVSGVDLWFFNKHREGAESRKALEALQKRAGFIEEGNRPEGLWREWERRALGCNGRDTRRLGRGCETSARDSFPEARTYIPHLNA